MSTASKTVYDEIASTGAHRLDQEGAPKPYAETLEPKFRGEVLALLKSAPTLQLATLDSEGWPVISGGPFVALSAEQDRPIVYYFTQAESAEAANATRDPRVSFMLFRATSFEQRRETRAVQMQGVARIVTDGAEIAAVRAEASARGEAFAAAATRASAILRIDAAFAVYSNISARPQWGSIDYAPVSEASHQRELRARGRIEAVIAEVKQLPGDVVAVKFAAKAGAAPLPSFPPGSHIQVFVRDDLVRPYSLCSMSAGSDGYQIGVLREPNSRGGSEFICAQWKPGQEVRISKPRNFFPVDRTAQRIVLVGGGVGITPLLAMAEHLAAAGSDFDLHYCYRNDARASFKEALSTASYKDRVRLHASEERRFDLAEDIGAPVANSHIYICGPPGFMDHYLAQARALGWTDAQLHRELFGGEADTSGSAFSVTLDDNKTFEVPAGKTIAQVLLSEGYQIEMSCERGICGSCVAEVVEGRIDHRDHFLTEMEKMENSMIALCCSRARTPSLKIVLPK